MSNIPLARKRLRELQAMPDLPLTVFVGIDEAVRLLTRAPAVRKAPAKRNKITEVQREQAIRLAQTTKMTIHEIAIATGINNSGRVSEILNGKR